MRLLFLQRGTDGGLAASAQRRRALSPPGDVGVGRLRRAPRSGGSAPCTRARSSTRVSAGSAPSRESDACICAGVPSKSRPHPPQKSVSPVKTARSDPSSTKYATAPSVWPGMWMHVAVDVAHADRVARYRRRACAPARARDPTRARRLRAPRRARAPRFRRRDPGGGACSRSRRGVTPSRCIASRTGRCFGRVDDRGLVRRSR